MQKLKGIFFFQTQKDYLKVMTKYKYGHDLLLIINYSLWPFLFYICFIHIKSHPNLFWQILLATILTEVIEHTLKRYYFWKRPLYLRIDKLPTGLVRSWYDTGSFPSGHMTKASYFFLLVMSHGLFLPSTYLLITIPLVFFRVFIGFHYPIDMLGGAGIGLLIWLSTHNLVFPDILVNLIKNIFIWFKI